MSVTYYDSEFLFLGIQQAMRMRHIIICVLFDCTMSFHIISQKVRF